MISTKMMAEGQGGLGTWARAELTENILPFWKVRARDTKTGGFYGILRDLTGGNPSEGRSIVMTARHLWTYSAAARELGDPDHLALADYAFNTVTRDFMDRINGGVFWSVRPDGKPEVEKKQIYGEAFALYGLSEYARALNAFGTARNGTTAESALDTAVGIYELLERYARDPIYGGYVEARARDWSKTGDLKLSDKDIDCEKSMNTNLHVMEAYTTLLLAIRTIKPRASILIQRIAESLSSLVFITPIRILGDNGHLYLYFNDDWSVIDGGVSYGHDIESSWLLWEAAETLSDSRLTETIRPVVLKIAETALSEGFDPKTGGMENEFHHGKKDKTRIWWCQAESLVGFYNAWQISDDPRFLEASLKVRDWIAAFQRDPQNGDWFWAVGADGVPDRSMPKGGNWKTGYHNGRCCMEILKRIGK